MRSFSSSSLSSPPQPATKLASACHTLRGDGEKRSTSESDSETKAETFAFTVKPSTKVLSPIAMGDDSGLADEDVARHRGLYGGAKLV
jgi:hypothetical protein